MTAPSHYYSGVPGLGNVAVTHHARSRAEALKVDEAAFLAALGGRETPDAGHVVWREANGVRVIVNRRPEPFSGAAVAITVMRVRRNERVKGGRG